MKSKILALFIAFTICFLSSSFGFCDGYSKIVSAATTDFVLPEEPYIYGFATGITAKDIAEDIYNNASLASLGYTDSNSYFFVNYNGYSGNCTVYVVFPSDFDYSVKARQWYNGSYVQLPFLLFSSCATAYGNFNNIENLSFTIVNSTQSGNKTSYGVADTTFLPNQSSHYFVDSFYYSSGFYMSDLEYSRSFCLGTYIIPPFVRDDYTLYGLDLAINETSFYEWIIENNKLSELPSYITQTKLLSFIEFYNDFGGSFKNFLVNIPDWFSHMNILNQTSENVNILKSSMDRLYQEYLNSFWREVGKGNAELLPHHRRNIQTQTTDDDLTLVTDDNTDTLDISILRDILRGIIQVSNQIGDGTNSIINKLDQLDFTVNLSNGGGTVTDLSVLYEYDINDFDDDFETFEENVSTITAVPLSYVQTINNNSLMPENMLSDKQNLSVTIPVINGFTVNEDCTEYETNTDTFTFNSTEYPWLDTIVKKMKRFASIMLIIGYLIHLRFKIADIVRGE